MFGSVNVHALTIVFGPMSQHALHLDIMDRPSARQFGNLCERYHRLRAAIQWYALFSSSTRERERGAYIHTCRRLLSQVKD